VSEQWRNRRALVTGATGIVGTWLCEELLARGTTVVAMVIDDDPQSRFYREGIDQGCRIVRGDLGRVEDCMRAINLHECDVVFHLGAQTIVGTALPRIVGDLGLNSLRLGIALLTVFFLFRDGDHLLDELRGVLRGLLGDRVQAYFTVIGDTTRAGVYGLLLAAFAQGLLAGLGYWVAGVNAPAFWGAATAVVAVIPFGAPLVWGSIGVWLLLQGQVGAGIGLLLWGTLAISWIDNLVRPLIISGVAKIPFLLVLYGVLGGLAAFGLIGLFVGPVILAILLALWRESTANNADPNVCPAP